tara:strand:+ start:593 stop:742 length:150 start_codon:yes stop_codon:yes gene_type:complete
MKTEKEILNKIFLLEKIKSNYKIMDNYRLKTELIKSIDDEIKILKWVLN